MDGGFKPNWFSLPLLAGKVLVGTQIASVYPCLHTDRVTANIPFSLHTAWMNGQSFTALRDKVTIDPFPTGPHIKLSFRLCPFMTFGLLQSYRANGKAYQ